MVHSLEPRAGNWNLPDRFPLHLQSRSVAVIAPHFILGNFKGANRRAAIETLTFLVRIPNSYDCQLS
jgi:hypothetical protein